MQVTIQNVDDFKRKALAFANQFDVCCLLDSNHYQDPYSKFDLLFAIDYIDKIETKKVNNSFEQLETFKQKNKGWLFGGLGYDFKKRD